MGAWQLVTGGEIELPGGRHRDRLLGDAGTRATDHGACGSGPRQREGLPRMVDCRCSQHATSLRSCLGKVNKNLNTDPTHYI
jgi:hypothetical protein